MIKSRTIIVITILSVFFTLFTGCTSDPVADDLTNYMNNQMQEVSKIQNKYLTLLSDITESENTNIQTVITQIKDEVLPRSDRLIAEAKKINPATEEVKILHNKYIAAMTKQNKGLVEMLKGLQNYDNETVKDGSKIITEANEEFTIFLNKIKVLAKEHGLEVQN